MKTEIPFRFVCTLLLLIIGSLLTTDYFHFACVIFVSGLISLLLLRFMIITFKAIQNPPRGKYIEVTEW